MSLRDVELKFKYRSDYDELHKDFYEVCIEQAKYYDRAVGYFNSQSLQLIAKGLERFIGGDGKIRIIANPHLNEADVEAIALGYRAKEDVILENFLREIKITEETIKDQTLNILAWLIYENKLEFKIAFTKNTNYLYHEKFGIFTDELGIQVAFSGSANETVGGMKNNFEKIDVFYEKHDYKRIQDMVEDFKRLWNNETNGLEIITMPKILVERIKVNRKSTKPSTSEVNILEEPTTEEEERIEIIPRDYQIEAIQAFEDNNWQGILEMATGTGKTITSLMIAQKYLEKNGRIFLIIMLPFLHLIDQWQENCEQLGFKHSIICAENRASWQDKLRQNIRDFNIGISKVEVILTTYKSACNDFFNQQVAKIRGKSFIIADECHYFGIPGLRNHQLHNVQARLGLSATPDRWWDEDGTKRLKEYFSKTVYEYSMQKAIENKVLTEYKYIPYIVNLEQDEQEKYLSLTKRLVYLLQNDGDKMEITKVNLARSMVLSKARYKKQLLYQILRSQEIEQISHTIVYCAKGEVTEITRTLAEMGIRTHRFNSELNTKTRKQVLKAFADGHIQVLVAIKCLDEGVDVPSTKVAYFLASTSNPREFVQRRGRILRKYKGKNIAELHDFIVLPEGMPDISFKSIASKEIPRFAEFAKYAINSFSCKTEVRATLAAYDLEYLLDKLPWDVYNEMKDQLEDKDEYKY